MRLSKNEVNKILDDLNIHINNIFNEYIAAIQMYDMGRNSVDQFDDHVTISPLVGEGVCLEPILMIEIKQFKNTYPQFISNVFHDMLVRAWMDCLSQLFSLFIELKIEDARMLENFKTIDAKIQLDFEQANINAQIQEGFVKDFNFKEHPKRYKIINKVLDPSNTAQKDLLDIGKNVMLRNCIQHHQSCIDSKTSKNQGGRVYMLDDKGAKQVYVEGDRFTISLPQIYSFKRSILAVIQAWRPKV
ncbi:MAG: hypothetical protein WA106_05675 [Methanothrix sp.]